MTFRFKESIGMATKVIASKTELNITLRQEQILRIFSQDGRMSLRSFREFLENPPANRTIGDDLA